MAGIGQTGQHCDEDFFAWARHQAELLPDLVASGRLTASGCDFLNLDDAVADHLRDQAAQTGCSMEDMARDILMQSLAPAVYGRAAVADLIRARNKGPFSEEGWEIIRRDRDSR